MKTLRLIAVFAFAAIFSISAFAQTGGAVPVAAQTGMAKIVVIDTGVFCGDEKGGIAKCINAVKSLNSEFAPVQNDLDATATKITTLEREIKIIQDQAAAGKVPIDQRAAQAKVDAYQLLQTEYKRKQEDAKAKLERRQEQLIAPVMQDISKAIQDFAAQKGYDMILDAAILEKAIIAYIPNKIDVTKEFIVYYNSRPGTTATAATPK